MRWGFDLPVFAGAISRFWLPAFLASAESVKIELVSNSLQSSQTWWDLVLVGLAVL